MPPDGWPVFYICPATQEKEKKKAGNHMAQVSNCISFVELAMECAFYKGENKERDVMPKLTTRRCWRVYIQRHRSRSCAFKRLYTAYKRVTFRSRGGGGEMSKQGENWALISYTHFIINYVVDVEKTHSVFCFTNKMAAVASFRKFFFLKGDWFYHFTLSA